MKSNKNIFRVSKLDYVLAGIILIFSFGSSIPLRGTGNHRQKEALVYEDGVLSRKILLNGNQVIRLRKMELRVSDGGIRVSKSDCPHQICAHSGRIMHPAQTLVCVPNKVLIEIVSVSGDIEFNAVSY